MGIIPVSQFFFSIKKNSAERHFDSKIKTQGAYNTMKPTTYAHLENMTVKEIQNDIFAILNFMIDDGYRPPNIEEAVSTLNTDEIRSKIRPYYDRKGHLKPKYKPIRNYLTRIRSNADRIDDKLDKINPKCIF